MDYAVTVTIVVPITARNRTQAEERAGRIEEWTTVNFPKSASWTGDVEISSEVVEN